MKKSPDEFRALLSLAEDAVSLHERLHRAGLHRSAQLMHRVVQEIGFEVAEYAPMRQQPRKREVGT